MEEVLSLAKKAAVDAVTKAGKIAKNRFGLEFKVEEKDDFGDLVTEVDFLAEEVILHAIRECFPDHQIRSEETGWVGVEGDWLWLVDPLDGTNNFAIGIPVFGVSITLMYKREPVLGVIYDSMLDKVYVAEKGKGSLCNGKPMQIRSRSELRKMTLGWIQGHQVQKNDEAMNLKHALDRESKRVLRLWAPTLLWCALARGDLDGIVLYNSEGDDLYAGVLMAKEAGALVMDFNGNPFERMNPEPYIIACHPDQRETFLELVREGVHPLAAGPQKWTGNTVQQDEPKWLTWAKQIQALSQAGLEYSKDVYDLERFEALRAISVDMAAHYTETEPEKVKELFASETGYATPKVDVRGVIFQRNNILLVREKIDGAWSLPGGWSDIGLSPSEVVVKEIKEESGYDSKAVRLLAVMDKKHHPHPPSPFHTYKLFISCEITGGEALSGVETSDVRFFGENELPELSVDRNTESQIRTMFEYLRNPDKPVIMD